MFVHGVGEWCQVLCKETHVACMAQAGLRVEEIGRLQEAHLEPREMHASRMGLERQGHDQEEVGGLEMVHLVRRGSDVM